MTTPKEPIKNQAQILLDEILTELGVINPDTFLRGDNPDLQERREVGYMRDRRFKYEIIGNQKQLKVKCIWDNTIFKEKRGYSDFKKEFETSDLMEYLTLDDISETWRVDGMAHGKDYKLPQFWKAEDLSPELIECIQKGALPGNCEYLYCNFIWV